VANKPDSPLQGKRDVDAVYVPRNRADALEYIAYLREAYGDNAYPGYSDDIPSIEHDWPHLAPRPRKVNVTRLIRQARKAGECGEVRVEILNHDGTRTIITSSRDSAPEMTTEADAEKLWHARIGNAAH
jgi:hypothetical protein